MRRAFTNALMLAAAFGIGPLQAQTAPLSPAELERRFDASLKGDEMAGWMKTMAAEPNHVGSPHDKANADIVLAQFKSGAGTRASKRSRCCIRRRSA